MLVVYVDDFKLSGPKANLAHGWSLMASKIKLEPPSSIKRYLGCEHVTFSHTVTGPFDPRSYWTRFEEPKKAFPELTFGANSITVHQGSTGSCEVRMIKYDMRSFMEQCVTRYVELCARNIRLLYDRLTHRFSMNLALSSMLTPITLRLTVFWVIRLIRRRRLAKACWAIVLRCS